MLVPRRILLGEISSYKAIVIARFLKINYPDIFIITYDYYRFTKFIHTKYSDKHLRLKVTPKNTWNYLSELSFIIKNNTIDVFIPVHSDTIGLILMNKNLFGRTLNYLGDYNDYLQLHNKDNLMQLAKKLSIKIPDEYPILSDIILPCVAKPVNLSASKGIYYLRTQKDLRKFINKNKSNYLFQELIKGEGCGFSVISKNGEILKGYGHKRLAEHPISGGSSVYRATYNDSRMKEVVSKVLKVIKWSGFAMFEFKLTADNKLYFIEVNPRIWGSINQGLQNGINYFEPILGKVLLPIINYIEKKTFFSPFIYCVLIKYAFNGRLKPLITFIRNIKHNKADVSFFNDPNGWLSLLLRKIL